MTGVSEMDPDPDLAEDLESEAANRRASRGDTDDRDGDDGVE